MLRGADVADRGAKGRGCFSARFRVQGLREADCGAGREGRCLALYARRMATTLSGANNGRRPLLKTKAGF